MKNYIKISVLLLIFSHIFFSCKIDVEEEQKFSKPTCDINAENCISISIRKYNSDTKYINIYRKDVTNKNPNAQFDCIGMIFPLNLPEEEDVNQFKDFLVQNGHTYIYYARFFDGETYTKTQDSNEIKIPKDGKCYPDGTDFSFNTSNASFEIDKNDYKITLNGEIQTPSPFTSPENQFSLMLVVSSSTATEAFPLPPLADGNSFYLRGILSKDFINTNIKIEGICGQKYERDNSNIKIAENDRLIKRIYWSELSTIKTKGITDNSLLIPEISNNSGFDYSRQIIYQ